MSYKRIAEAIFGGGDLREDVEEDVEQADIERDEKKANQPKSASAYVRVIEGQHFQPLLAQLHSSIDIINELDVSDNHLFIESELDIIHRFRNLPCALNNILNTNGH